ncbi:hypothetical protein B7939_00920 [Eggerthia catenaformis]|nr:hypothetical protein B7939_00920 [Eggerthia catenaformis]
MDKKDVVTEYVINSCFVSKAKITDIADWFILKSKMSNKRVQKLCYYAEAWCQVLYGQSITEDAEFQAWVHGPVNSVLYEKFRDYGWREFKITNPEETKKRLDKILCKEQIEVLESVWETYGEYGADELEELTHKEKPWLEKRAGLGIFESGDRVISKETMRQYYSERQIN